MIQNHMYTYFFIILVSASFLHAGKSHEPVNFNIDPKIAHSSPSSLFEYALKSLDPDTINLKNISFILDTSQEKLARMASVLMHNPSVLNRLEKQKKEISTRNKPSKILPIIKKFMLFCTLNESDISESESLCSNLEHNLEQTATGIAAHLCKDGKKISFLFQGAFREHNLINTNVNSAHTYYNISITSMGNVILYLDWQNSKESGYINIKQTDTNKVLFGEQILFELLDNQGTSFAAGWENKFSHSSTNLTDSILSLWKLNKKEATPIWQIRLKNIQATKNGSACGHLTSDKSNYLVCWAPFLEQNREKSVIFIIPIAQPEKYKAFHFSQKIIREKPICFSCTFFDKKLNLLQVTFTDGTKEFYPLHH